MRESLKCTDKLPVRLELSTGTAIFVKRKMHFILCKRNTSVTVIKGFYLEFGHINWYNNCVDNNKF